MVIFIPEKQFASRTGNRVINDSYTVYRFGDKQYQRGRAILITNNLKHLGIMDYDPEAFTGREDCNFFIDRNGRLITAVDNEDCTRQCQPTREILEKNLARIRRTPLLERRVSSNEIRLKDIELLTRLLNDPREQQMDSIDNAYATRYLSEDMPFEISEAMKERELTNIDQWFDIEQHYLLLRAMDKQNDTQLSQALIPFIKARTHISMALEDSTPYSDLDQKYADCLTLLYRFSPGEGTQYLLELFHYAHLLAKLRDAWKQVPEDEWNAARIWTQASAQHQPEQIESLVLPDDSPDKLIASQTRSVTPLTEHSEPLSDQNNKTEECGEPIRRLSLSETPVHEKAAPEMEDTQNLKHREQPANEVELCEFDLPSPPESPIEPDPDLPVITLKADPQSEMLPPYRKPPPFDERQTMGVNIVEERKPIYDPERYATPGATVATQPLKLTTNKTVEQATVVTGGPAARKKTKKSRATVSSVQVTSGIHDQKTLSARLVANYQMADDEYQSRKDKLLAHVSPSHAKNKPADPQTGKEEAWSAANRGFWPVSQYSILMRMAVRNEYNERDKPFTDLYTRLSDLGAFTNGISPYSTVVTEASCDEPCYIERTPYFDMTHYGAGREQGTVFSLHPGTPPDKAIESLENSLMFCDLFQFFQLRTYRTFLDYFGKEAFNRYFSVKWPDSPNSELSGLTLSSALGKLDSFMANRLYKFLKPRTGGSVQVGDIIFFHERYHKVETKGLIDSPPPIAGVCTRKGKGEIYYTVPGHCKDFKLHFEHPVTEQFNVFYFDFSLLRAAKTRCEKPEAIRLPPPKQPVREKTSLAPSVPRYKRKTSDKPVQNNAPDLKTNDGGTTPPDPKKLIISEMNRLMENLKQELRKIKKGGAYDAENFKDAYYKLKAELSTFRTSTALDEDTRKQWTVKIIAALNGARNHLT
ncbi:hypothetical protein [Endozoicomonas elysicola]|uniref:Uncharacterized protein n=1 Tax=Endozoicomonas elysicola TaxID=305900 RepID=A0A081KAV6_9GAMM|nr:hypothetical protein [Endozoicomonas elysicola]KEI71282.1 hypothetical protein GV64_11505 [Endozoicomonas elysicola]